MTGPGSEEVSRVKRNICGKVDDWTLVLKRSQGVINFTTNVPLGP
jgi:hypothetical protein